jgi:hypothetical protein
MSGFPNAALPRWEASSSPTFKCTDLFAAENLNGGGFGLSNRNYLLLFSVAAQLNLIREDRAVDGHLVPMRVCSFRQIRRTSSKSTWLISSSLAAHVI